MRKAGIMVAGVTVIPELAVRDVDAAARMLRDVFGFHADGAVMRLGDQALALVAAEGVPGHGRIDHLALMVADVDLALAGMMARGARLEATTPDGPREIAEFWETGMRYVFLEGPEGAKLELCARLAGPVRDGLPGHDHIGIPCADIDAMAAFFGTLGFAPVAAHDLVRADGVTRVQFLQAGDGVVELYAAPGEKPAVADTALWRGLRLEGSGLVRGVRQGPDGMLVTVA